MLSAFFYGNSIRIELLSDYNDDFTYEDERSIRQRYRMFSVDRVLRRSSCKMCCILMDNSGSIRGMLGEENDIRV